MPIETSYDQLRTWLLEQIAKDERMAREFEGVIPEAYWVDDLEPSPEHITLYVSPTRVLAECATKRRIIALFGTDGSVLCLLALPYAARPGYREEWAA